MRRSNALTFVEIWVQPEPPPTHATLYVPTFLCRLVITPVDLSIHAFHIPCSQANTLPKTTLTYSCLCNDGKTPNTSEYSLTLPYFICGEWVSQCVAGCDSNSTCQGICQQDHPCGATDPVTNQVNSTATASSTSASSTSDGSTVYTGLGGNNGKSAAGPPAFELARLYATLATLGLFGVGFAYLL